MQNSVSYAEIIIRATCTQCVGSEVTPDSFVHVCWTEEVWIPRNSVEDPGGESRELTVRVAR